MSKIDPEKAKKAIPLAVLRLLPVGSLFLPLCTMTFNLVGLLGTLLGGEQSSGGLGGLDGLLGGLGGGGGKITQYNIVTLIQGMVGQDNELLTRLIKADFMAEVRTWLYVIAAGLGLSILAMLAGFAFLSAEKIKSLAASAAIYGVGTLGMAGALAGFAFFQPALDAAALNVAAASLSYGAWVLAAMLLLNLVVCLALWRGARERERLTALARKQKKKK